MFYCLYNSVLGECDSLVTRAVQDNSLISEGLFADLLGEAARYFSRLEAVILCALYALMHSALFYPFFEVVDRLCFTAGS